MRFPRRSALAAALAGSLVAASGAGAATRLGPDVTTTPPPVHGCGAATCTALQFAGGAPAPAAGVLTAIELRHGPASSVLGDTVRVLVVRRTGTAVTVVRQAGQLTLTGMAADQTTRAALRAPVAAGEEIALQAETFWIGADGPLKLLAAADAGMSAGVRSGAHSGGTAAYTEHAGRLLLAAVTLEPDADGDGAGDETQDPDGGAGAVGGGAGGGSGSAGSGSGGGAAGGSAGGTGAGSGEAPAAQCPAGAAGALAALAPPRATALEDGELRLAAAPPEVSAARAGGWKATVIDRSDNFNDVAAAFDRDGRLHVAGRGAFHHRVVYWGPGGHRIVEATNDTGSVALAVPRSGAVVGYGMDQPSSAGGRLEYCDVLKLATAPGLTPQIQWAHSTTDTAFVFAGLAADPAGDVVHAVYEVGRGDPALVYRKVGGAPERLPLSGGVVRAARVAAAGRYVAVAARTDRHLLTYVRRGDGPFKRTRIDTRAGQFDLGLGRDGRPRLAYVDRRGRLAIYNGRRVMRTRAPMAGVAIAVAADGALHVAASPTAQACHTTSIWRCTRGGLYHLRTDPSAGRGTISTVQSTTGFAPGQLAIAVKGRSVAIAYGDPRHGKRLTVRRRG